MVLEAVEKRIESEKTVKPKPTLEEVTLVRSLNQRLPEVWRHQKIDPAIKKRIIRIMVKEVLIRLDETGAVADDDYSLKGRYSYPGMFKKTDKGSSTRV